MGARENKCQISQNDMLHMKSLRILPVFSQFLWNLTFIFSDSREKFSLVLLQMTNYIFSPWKMKKKKAVFHNLFWYKVFVQWKLKLPNFLMDSVLTLKSLYMFLQRGHYTFCTTTWEISDLIGLEQWYFSLIWNTYLWKLQTFCGY